VSRNLALGALAAAVVASEPSVAVGGAAAVALVLGASRWRRSGPELGAMAPGFDELPGLLARGKPILLVFSSSSCGACRELEPEIEEWRRDYTDDLTIQVVESQELAGAYGAEGTPSAVRIGVDGTLTSSVALGAYAIRGLVDGEGEAAAGTLARREFVVRLAGGVAGAAALVIQPARAIAALRPRAEPPCRPACGPNADCVDGECVCVDAGFPDQCGRKCTNFIWDNANCGGCAGDCPPGKRCKCNKFEVCAGRRCVSRDGDDSCVDPCPPGSGKICCEGRCGDPRHSEKHCGGCGQRCFGRTPRCCNGICRDIDADANYCGGCSFPARKVCKPPTPICHAGKCRASCPKPLVRCGNSCLYRNLERCCGDRVFSKEQYPLDEYNCCRGRLVKNSSKSCGPNCQSCTGATDTGVCCGGECCTYNAPTCCGGKCVNTSLSVDHCGECDHRCRGKPPVICRFGQGCICGDPPGACDEG
jgi:thiol-disulfide isomerase/thioredoxin